jgi:toxin ParE1/3/4
VKPYALRPQAREDRRHEVRYYRQNVSAKVAAKLVEALERGLRELERQPAIGSLTLGQAIGLAGMRTWRVDGFPLTYWYFERETLVDVARLVSQRQDALAIDIVDE